MAYIHIPRQQLDKPRGRFEVAPNFGLSGLWVPSVAPMDLIRGVAITRLNGGGLSVDPSGQSALFAKALQQRASGFPVGADWSRYSIIAQVFPTGTDASYSNVFNAYLSGVLGYVQLRHTTANWDFYHNSTAGWVLAQGAGLYAEGRVQTLVCTFDGAKIALYVNGFLVATSAATGYSAGAQPDGFTIGSDVDASGPMNGTYYDGHIGLIGLANGVCWETKQASSLSENPWQLSRADPIRIYSLPSGGASQDLAASGAATASGTASAAAQVALAGVGVSLAGGSAALAGSKPLEASGAGTASGTATPKIDIALSAMGLTVSSGTAALSSSASGSLHASGAATAGGSAATVANVTISASGLAQAAAQAGVSASVLLAGAGAAAASGNAALAVQLQALAAGAAQASGSATISGSAAGELSAYGQAAASGAALLTLDVRIAAAGSAAADGSAALSSGSAAQIAAAGGATASGAGTVSAQVTLTGAGFVQAMGAGVLNVQIPLQAIGAAISVGTASLSELPDVLPRVASPYRTWRVRAHNRTLRIRA